MKNIQSSLSAVNWRKITEQMNEKGYAIFPRLLSHAQCEKLTGNYNKTNLYRKTIVMERYRFGLGEYKYFNYPLPGLIQTIRENVYPHLAPISNSWMKELKIDKQFPGTFPELQTLCHDNNQTKPTALILKYGKGGYNTLHQDLYGDIFFPIQVVLFLNEPGEDYTGGEFVLTQQTPRAQSKAIVLKPKKGDMLMFTTNFRPVKGSKGYYRVNMKHGVSELHDGERHTLGIIFPRCIKLINLIWACPALRRGAPPPKGRGRAIRCNLFFRQPAGGRCLKKRISAPIPHAKTPEK